MGSVHIKPAANEYAKSLDEQTRGIIDEKISDLAANYKHGSYLLTKPLYGLRSIHARDQRILFAVCTECRKNDWLEYNQPRCECCGELPKDAIHVIKIGPKKHVYDSKRDKSIKTSKKRKKKKKKR